MHFKTTPQMLQKRNILNVMLYNFDYIMMENDVQLQHDSTIRLIKQHLQRFDYLDQLTKIKQKHKCNFRLQNLNRNKTQSDQHIQKKYNQYQTITPRGQSVQFKMKPVRQVLSQLSHSLIVKNVEQKQQQLKRQVQSNCSLEFEQQLDKITCYSTNNLSTMFRDVVTDTIEYIIEVEEQQQNQQPPQPKKKLF